MLKFIFDFKNRDFMRLWWAQIISQFGDRLNQMALIGLMTERSAGSVTALAKLLAFTIIPVFIIGPIAGVFVDRWDSRKTLLWCDLLRGLLVLLIPMSLMGRVTLVPIYIVVFLIFCFSRFYVPAKMAIVPDLVVKEQLLMANSLISTTGMIAAVLGFAIGGFLVDAIGARGGFIGDAVTYFLSAILIFNISKDFRLRFNRRHIMESGRQMLKAEQSVWREMKEGLVYLFSRKELRFVISMLFLVLAAAGSIYVVIIVFIQESFNSVTRDLGILAVCLCAGLFVGVLLYGRFGKAMAWYRTMFVCLINGGAGIILFSQVVRYFPNLILAGALAAGLGMVIGPIFITANTITHLVSDEQMRGKVFAGLEIVIHLAFLLAMLGSSWLAEFIPTGHILAGVGAVFGLIGLAGLFRYRHGRGLLLAKTEE